MIVGVLKETEKHERRVALTPEVAAMLVKQELDRYGVEIPYPQVALWAGSGTAPLPVTVVHPADQPENG